MAPALPQAADNRLLLRALHSPGLRTTVYFFKLFSCGGPDMAPALPQAADDRLLLQGDRLSKTSRPA
jgi:hypothetical protein